MLALLPVSLPLHRSQSVIRRPQGYPIRWPIKSTLWSRNNRDLRCLFHCAEVRTDDWHSVGTTVAPRPDLPTVWCLSTRHCPHSQLLLKGQFHLRTPWWSNKIITLLNFNPWKRTFISWKMKVHTKHSWCPGNRPSGAAGSGLSRTRHLLHVLERTTNTVTVIQTCLSGRFFSKMSEVSLSHQGKQFVVVVRDKI